jgi:hypothetical protein
VVRALLQRVDPARHAAGGIYGTIVTAATIAAASEGPTSVGEIVLTVTVTLTLYWVAHAYANVIAAAHGETRLWNTAMHELAAESAMVTACFLPLAILVVASLLGADVDLSTSLAGVFATGLLLVWGFLAARRAHRGTGQQVLSGILFGLLGLVIVALKTAINH